MTFRVAVVGTGAFAREHVLALRGIPGVTITHVAGSDLARASALAALACGANATTDIHAAVCGDDVDAVDVVNATPDHHRWTVAAGEAGKHVHVDKPAALTVSDFDEMVQATEGRGGTLMVGQTVRFQPVIAELQQALARGDIGDPKLLHVSWYTGHVWPNGWRGWQLDVSRSGGHPVHNGTHSIDLAVWLTGSRPVEVFARNFPTFAAEMPMPDSFQVQVRFESGALATLELCYALRQPGEFLRRIVLVGTEGTLAHSTDDDPGLSSPGHPVAPPSIEKALDLQLSHWVRAAQGLEPFIVTTSEARVALATAVAAQRSLETGQPVRVAHHAPGAGMTGIAA
ncbi:MAG: myo-inositol 2-dehydrogenase / D-chiro-inositol 1-dehydrogenase [Subtercola sp.]|nr:myo-inositol 2-dehydrogenase / D-chiro-inositol 1-dehydrogenase [Subtercola sp.]